jgi:PhoH-like ATPase
MVIKKSATKTKAAPAAAKKKAAPAKSTSKVKTSAVAKSSKSTAAQPKKVTAVAKKAKAPATKPKLYILDTSVLMHDPTCLIRFAEHDLMIPFVTLEELDNNKVGTADKHRNARSAIRMVEQVVEGASAKDYDKGFPLATIAGEGAGRLFVREDASAELLAKFDSKFDNRFIALLQELHEEQPEKTIVLVSKDINLRIKAKVLGFTAEDYKSDKVIEDSDLLWRGYREVEDDFLTTHLAGGANASWNEAGLAHYSIKQPQEALLNNEFLVFADGSLYQAYECEANTAKIRQRINHGHKDVWGVKAKNEEQSMALNLLLDPTIDFVTLLGPAGTGKTLLTLAAGLEQTLETKTFAEILFTRATVSIGDDIGFLPGTEEEKMLPWLGAMEDNLDALTGHAADGNEWKHGATRQLIMDKIKIKSISFMRGRTFHSKFVIIDEAQNLTAKQMKALITRAGDGTKIICMGNLTQIDTPYLSESNSGLAYAAERFKGWEHYGHIILEKGERSRLANRANEVL